MGEALAWKYGDLGDFNQQKKEEHRKQFLSSIPRHRAQSWSGRATREDLPGLKCSFPQNLPRACLVSFDLEIISQYLSPAHFRTGKFPSTYANRPFANSRHRTHSSFHPYF